MSVQSTQKSACLEVRVSLSWSGMRAGQSVPLKSVCLRYLPGVGVAEWRQGVCGSWGMGVERISVGGGAAICEPPRGGTIRPKAAVAAVGLGQVSVVLSRSWEEGTVGASWGRVNVSGGRGQGEVGLACLSLGRKRARE